VKPSSVHRASAPIRCQVVAPRPMAQFYPSNAAAAGKLAQVGPGSPMPFSCAGRLDSPSSPVPVTIGAGHREVLWESHTREG
jgi:hypothetical protein